MTGMAATAIDIGTPMFARRLAVLLSERRSQTRASLRSLAQRSNGAVTIRMLQELERGAHPIDDSLVSVVSALYGADLAAIVPERVVVSVPAPGVVAVGSVRRTFQQVDDDSLLLAYLRLVRSIRHEEKSETLVLRRDDVEALASHLELPGSVVLERLLSLVGSTRAQRSAMLSLLATGALVLGLSSSALASDPGVPITALDAPPPSMSPPATIVTTNDVLVSSAPVVVVVLADQRDDSPQVPPTTALTQSVAPPVVQSATPSGTPSGTRPSAPIVTPVDVPVDESSLRIDPAIAEAPIPRPPTTPSSTATAPDPLPIPLAGSSPVPIPQILGAAPAPGDVAVGGVVVPMPNLQEPVGAPPIQAPIPVPAPVVFGDDTSIVLVAP